MDTSESDQFFGCMCRTCMHELVVVASYETNTKSSQHWRSILDKSEEYESLRIIDLLASAIPQIKVHLNDEMPKKICRKCLEELNSIYRFQQMCVQTDQELQRLTGKGNATTTEPHKMRTNENESFQAATEQEPSQSSSADPLQSIEVNVKKEPSDDEWNTEYSDEDTVKSAVNIEPEVIMTVQPETTATEKKTLPSSEFSCAVCNKSFRELRYMKSHMKRHNDPEENPKKKKKANEYPCEICNKTFKNANKLSEHLNTHTGERPFLCPECGKAFSTKSALSQHSTRHAPPDAFECPLCPRKFRTKNDISRHKVIHYQIKKHICDICGRGFIKPHMLRDHKRYHNPVKPYKCDYCDMRFVSKYNNISHMRTHTGEKPWNCKYCEGKFARSSDLMYHLRKHIGINVYRCEYCPSAFRLATELREHIVVHKNEDEETRERNMKALKEAEAELELKIAKERAQQVVESEDV